LFSAFHRIEKKKGCREKEVVAIVTPKSDGDGGANGAKI
jgi:hypothetical protein